MSLDAASEDASDVSERDQLLTHLAGHGIDVQVVAYPEHTTIEEGKRLRGDLPGTFTKNLLLRDKKANLFFITAHEDTHIELRTLHTRIGARGRLGFASPEVMTQLLHVEPGTATPLALRHDTNHAVTLVIDDQLEDLEQLNFHPMNHTESIGLSWAELVTFANATGHPPVVAALNGTAAQPPAYPREP